MVYKLNAEDVNAAKEEIKEYVSGLAARLDNDFGDEYIVSLGKDTEIEDDWSYDIKIRKGNKVGASLSLHWKKQHFNDLNIEVSESTKIGSFLMYVIVFPFMLIGAYMGANHIAPLDFLPGYKLAGALGGVIALIPGIILTTLIKSVILRKYKEENASLMKKALSITGNTFQKI
ncbi:hypothetical protein ATO12_20980 [Aquimarina atlantica]|uniref:Uncharacterized protein n=1 Tax=Aquimarina atlantica TaxID=1317122 RepID=A0A023BS43_9FLAO|nr:hypothetical protein [Aquimarina atlantica]EZH72613.1 hypothetical protein ATO12_20980 [Aquimarina atlantica]